MLPAIGQAVLSQVIQALKDDSMCYYETLGFGREELNELDALTFEELVHMGNTSAQLPKIAINHNALRRVPVQVHQEQKFQ